MNIHAMKSSKFLKKEDVQTPILVTIKNITQDNVAPDDKPEEIKHILNFREDCNPLVLNWTNIQLIASFLGEETDNWTGKKIVLFHDPNVSYGGKLIGGVRARKPKQQAPAVESDAAEPFNATDEDVPF